jgi:hypothetical protein
MKRVNFYLPDLHFDDLVQISQQNQRTMTDVVRIAFDYCFREVHLNEMFPLMSGQIQLSRGNSS